LLTPGATYVRPDGQVVGTGQQLIDAGVFSLTERLVSGPWQSGDGAYRDSLTWTGSTDISSTGSAADTCDDWTLTTGPSGRLGRTFTTDSGYWDHGTQGCNVPSARLFCVEQ
jgi:hypothetical protein